MNSEWTIPLNVKHKTINLPEDKRGENLGDLGFWQCVFRHNTKSTNHGRKTDKMISFKLKIYL